MSEEFKTATVGTVTDDGIKLIFEGTSTQSEKEYKANTSINFKAGDKVKIVKDSGTYIVEYIIGSPCNNYPIPSGGSDGQILTKVGTDDFSVQWASPAEVHGLLPSGGSTGQYLVKNSAEDYDAVWKTFDEKISTLELNGKQVTLSASAFYPSSTLITLGNASNPFTGVYLNGSMQIGTGSASTTTKLGFFGKSPIARQTLSSSETVSSLVTKLKNYGLFG